MPTAPNLVVFDTNWFIHNLADVMCRVEDIAREHKDASILIPGEVLRELDRLKDRGKDEETKFFVSLLVVRGRFGLCSAGLGVGKISRC